MIEVEPVAAPKNETIDLGIDPVLLRACVHGTNVGIRMTHAEIVPVGTSRLVNARHSVSVMVGLVGSHSGNIALNLSEAGVLHFASGLLGTKMTEIDEDVVDAIMEIGNMVAGGIKTALAETKYAMTSISLPSLIFGRQYNMAYARGIRVISVEFEIAGMPFASMNARYLSATLSLMQTSGVDR
jgi:CheY-specific phosphatase CheX